jgi:hypothetical protein
MKKKMQPGIKKKRPAEATAKQGFLKLKYNLGGA